MTAADSDESCPFLQWTVHFIYGLFVPYTDCSFFEENSRAPANHAAVVP